VLFGAGRFSELPGIVARLGTRALVLTGAHPERHPGLPAGLLSTVDSEPTVELARAVTAKAREHRTDVVVSVGGGSVIDLGKAVAALLATGGDPLDHLEVVGRGQPITSPSVPFVAVPTTAGTGAEVTANATLISTEHRLKASLRSPYLLPRVALVDPELTLACPPSVTASSGLDALTQCLEPLVSARANPVTDALAREGLRRAGSGLRRAYADGSDLDARTDMALCALFGGMALANAKLGTVHGFAGVVGGMVDVPHGMACAAFLVPVVEANIRALTVRAPDSPALQRYAEAARLLTGDPRASTVDGVEWLRETVALLGVPRVAVPDDPELVGKVAKASSTQGNPVVLTDGELREILARATG
jgi:alcohol dehydrogenase class IV